MGFSNALKSVRYLDLTMDLEVRGYGAHLFAIEVGARGLVGRSTYAFPRFWRSSREFFLKYRDDFGRKIFCRGSLYRVDSPLIVARLRR